MTETAGGRPSPMLPGPARFRDVDTTRPVAAMHALPEQICLSAIHWERGTHYAVALEVKNGNKTRDDDAGADGGRGERETLPHRAPRSSRAVEVARRLWSPELGGRDLPSPNSSRLSVRRSKGALCRRKARSRSRVSQRSIPNGGCMGDPCRMTRTDCCALNRD